MNILDRLKDFFKKPEIVVSVTIITHYDTEIPDDVERKYGKPVNVTRGHWPCFRGCCTLCGPDRTEIYELEVVEPRVCPMKP